MKPKSILCFGGPVLDSYLLVEDGMMEKYGISKGQMALYDDLTPPENVIRMRAENKFTDFEMGGSAINTMKAYSMLGGETGLFCAYGNDYERKQIIESECERLGMKLYSCIHEDSPTSYLMILVTPDAQRTTLGSFYPSFHVDSSKVDFSIVKDYDYSFIESYSFTKDPKQNAVFKTLEAIEQYDSKFIFALSNPFCAFQFKDEMTRFMNHKNCKIVLGNAAEYTTLFPEYDGLEGVMKHLHERNQRENKWEIVLATDGSRGAWVIFGGELTHLPAPDVSKIVDTTGAGDYFAAGVLFALMNGYGMEVAKRLSAMLTGDIICKVGVRPSDSVVAEAKAYVDSCPRV